MDRAIRVLHLEDDASDAGLVRDLLEAGGIACDITRVQTREDFVASLGNGALDLILADHSLPSFDGMSALKIAAQRSPDVPFIFVSGTLGEEVAVEALKLGATDYVLKDRLSRILSAVRSALRDAEFRAERERAEAERLKLEERLRQAERMESIGRFASSIAHEFNNLLGGIIAFGEMLFDEAPENTPRKRYAQNVLTAATRGSDLVEQILAFTRSQRRKNVPTDVGRTVVETLELVRGLLPESITMEATIPDEPLVVMGDGTQLHQIVMNLCSNAIDAMKVVGPLRVAITALDLRADSKLSHGTLRPGAYVRLSVEDCGCGMDEATLARIFEPFFTTKEAGRGTGLGLALVYAIVADYGGAIDVKSRAGEGSVFSIYLPMAHVTEGVAAKA